LFAVYLVFPLIFRIRLKQKFLKFVPSKKNTIFFTLSFGLSLGRPTSGPKGYLAAPLGSTSFSAALAASDALAAPPTSVHSYLLGLLGAASSSTSLEGRQLATEPKWQGYRLWGWRGLLLMRRCQWRNR